MVLLKILNLKFFSKSFSIKKAPQTTDKPKKYKFESLSQMRGKA
jgi:hypothetical protein